MPSKKQKSGAAYGSDWWNLRPFTLSEAFERVGRRLFGDEWAGQEWSAHQCTSPEERLSSYDQHDHLLEQAEAEEMEVQARMAATTNDLEMGELRQARAEAQNKITAARLALARHPKPTDIDRWQFETFQRKCAAEATLMGAIRKGELRVHDGRNGPIGYVAFSHPKFHYNVEMSAVWAPKYTLGRRRVPVRIDERDFYTWLQSVSPSSEPLKQRCRDLLRMWVAQSPERPAITKTEYRKTARNQIDGLTKRMFDSLWDQEAPADWKLPGPRTRRKSPH